MRLYALPLLFAVPAAAQPAPAWNVAEPGPIATRALTFDSQGARLAGTLYYPAGGRALATVVALHGAQAPLRSEPLYRHLRETLPRLGIAVFLYDRRGSGASQPGRADPGDFDVLAADAVAARAMLTRLPEVDPRRVGYWGLSQGGWLALQAAVRDPSAAFTVAISAPMAGADVQMNFAVANAMRVKGYPEADVRRAIAARTAVDDYARGRGTRAAAAAAEAGIASEPWYRETYIRGNIDDPAWRKQMATDPLAALDRSRVPTLILYGQGDPWVPVGASLAALAGSATRHRHVTVRVIAGADHAMMLNVPPKQQMDLAFAKAAAPDAPDYFATLAAWLGARGMTVVR